MPAISRTGSADHADKPSGRLAANPGPGSGREGVTVTVRYFAAARAAAGATDEQLTLCLDEAAVCTVADVLDAAVARHGAALQRVLQRSSFLLDEVAVHGGRTPVTSGQTVDVLPPFAGG